jgi:hypothetical protein
VERDAVVRGGLARAPGQRGTWSAPVRARLR